VPLFNYERFIRDCVKSILGQSYPNFELIVVDDCSPDNGYEVVQEMAEKDPRMRVIQLAENGGYSHAKNEGIIISQGEFITCLDADDMFTEHSLRCRVRALLKHGADFVHANALNVYGGMTLKDAVTMQKRKRKTPVIHAQTVMLKREVHQQHGLYDDSLRSRGDKEMWVRLFGPKGRGKHLVKKIFISDDVAYYRLHKRSMMSKRKRQRKLQRRVKAAYAVAVAERRKNGITEKNTRFLKT
jgi:glycosyltransferase involved in cell wall biosynthesis